MTMHETPIVSWHRPQWGKWLTRTGNSKLWQEGAVMCLLWGLLEGDA